MLKRERTNDRTGRHTSQKILALMLAAVFAGQLAKAQTRYTITDLGVLPAGNYSEAFGINNRGQVTGSSDLAPGQNRAFLYWHGRLQSIGTLGGDLSYGAGINEHGQLVGPSNVTAGGSLHAFLYTAGHLQDLGTSDGDASFATGINNRGAVAGVIQDGLNRHGFIYDGQMHAIIVDDYSFANGINDKNEVVGFSGTSLITDNGPVYAFLWKNGKAKHLPSLGGDISEANAINNAGHIVGYSRFSDDGLDHAFLYADGITKALNSASDVSSFAQAINSHDQAVGVCTGHGNLGAFACLYEFGRTIDLNRFLPENSGWILNQANGINDLGQIVVIGTARNGLVQHSFLMTPTGGNNTSVLSPK